MYSVVIIDDEELIVEGLRRGVDWEKFGCRVVGYADDAFNGRSVILEKRPDIIFTDIKMPNEDGLTMLAGLKGQFPIMQIAVLTGYREFGYAKRAIELGVSRYLLKPSKMNELEEALKYMTDELDQRRGRKLRDEPNKDEQKLRETASERANSFLVRKAEQYINEHYAEKIMLSEVADHCYVSQWHLSKLFNRFAGGNFYDLLNSTRIEKAKELLCDPAMSISNIAATVGYSDTSHFSRVFKKMEKISANEYRNIYCGENKP